MLTTAHCSSSTLTSASKAEQLSWFFQDNKVLSEECLPTISASRHSLFVSLCLSFGSLVTM